MSLCLLIRKQLSLSYSCYISVVNSRQVQKSGNKNSYISEQNNKWNQWAHYWVVSLTLYLEINKMDLSLSE